MHNLNGAGDPARNTHRSADQVKADQDKARRDDVKQEQADHRRTRRAI